MALLAEVPFEAEVALGARLRVGRNERDEKRAGLDLRTDIGFPRIATDELVLVKPHFHTGRAQGLRDAPRYLRILGRVADEYGAGSGHGARLAEKLSNVLIKSSLGGACFRPKCLTA